MAAIRGVHRLETSQYAMLPESIDVGIYTRCDK